MSATGLQLNWSSVTFGATPITRITSLDINPGGTLIKFKGDANIYPVVVANADNEPTVAITSGDVGTLYGFSIGAQGTITATLLDAKQASGGAINFTCINCVFRGPSMNASHAQFASASANFDLFSSDGTTSPISFTRS
jgi:hypothetical protein